MARLRKYYFSRRYRHRSGRPVRENRRRHLRRTSGSQNARAAWRAEAQKSYSTDRHWQQAREARPSAPMTTGSVYGKAHAGEPDAALIASSRIGKAKPGQLRHHLLWLDPFRPPASSVKVAESSVEAPKKACWFMAGLDELETHS